MIKKVTKLIKNFTELYLHPVCVFLSTERVKLLMEIILLGHSQSSLAIKNPQDGLQNIDTGDAPPESLRSGMESSYRHSKNSPFDSNIQPG